MIHYNYSKEQLEKKGEELLYQFDPERLERPKPIDVYSVIEKCLDVPYDWKYLTPDQSIYGMTVFKAGWAWVWPAPYYKDGMEPLRAYFDEGTIVIDSTLTEYEYPGVENFTVMHAVFHQVLQKAAFRRVSIEDVHRTTRQAIDGDRRRPMTSLEICEYQANACAAAFLMPRAVVKNELRRITSSDSRIDLSDIQSDYIVRQMAHEFSVSQKALRYRLLNLGLAVA